MRLIDNHAERNAVSGSALQLIALLYPRPGELRQADWSEFDLENATWVILVSRMKMRRPHAKPLSRQAVQILHKLHKVTGPKGFAFPAQGRGACPMSENTMKQALKRLGIATLSLTICTTSPSGPPGAAPDEAMLNPNTSTGSPQPNLQTGRTRTKT